jgi:parvulin-like peptidyl-prolyl isomerase
MENKNKKKCRIANAALALVLGVGLSLAGCGGGAAADDSEAVAKVGDVTITENQLNAFTEFMFFMYGFDLSGLAEEEKNTYKADTLDSMVQAAALAQYYEGKDALPEDFDANLKQFTDMVHQTEGVDASFAEKGITDDTLKYYMETQLYFQALAAEATNDGALPTESEIEAYYAAHEQEFPETEERRVSHILVGDENHTDEDRKLAEEIREKIASGAETFEDMSREYGTDGTSAAGGDLGYAAREAYVQEFSDVAFTLPVDELSGIVESQFGFHILKVTDIRSARSVESQRESISSTLTYELSDARVQALVAEYGVTYLSDKYPAPADRTAALDVTTDGTTDEAAEEAAPAE